MCKSWKASPKISHFSQISHFRENTGDIVTCPYVSINLKQKTFGVSDYS